MPFRLYSLALIIACLSCGRNQDSSHIQMLTPPTEQSLFQNGGLVGKEFWIYTTEEDLSSAAKIAGIKYAPNAYYLDHLGDDIFWHFRDSTAVSFEADSSGRVTNRKVPQFFLGPHLEAFVTGQMDLFNYNKLPDESLWAYRIDILFNYKGFPRGGSSAGQAKATLTLACANDTNIAVKPIYKNFDLAIENNNLWHPVTLSIPFGKLDYEPFIKLCEETKGTLSAEVSFGIYGIESLEQTLQFLGVHVTQTIDTTKGADVKYSPLTERNTDGWQVGEDCERIGGTYHHCLSKQFTVSPSLPNLEKFPQLSELPFENSLTYHFLCPKYAGAIAAVFSDINQRFHMVLAPSTTGRINNTPSTLVTDNVYNYNFDVRVSQKGIFGPECQFKILSNTSLPSIPFLRNLTETLLEKIAIRKGYLATIDDVRALKAEWPALNQISERLKRLATEKSNECSLKSLRLNVLLQKILKERSPSDLELIIQLGGRAALELFIQSGVPEINFCESPIIKGDIGRLRIEQETLISLAAKVADEISQTNICADTKEQSPACSEKILNLGKLLRSDLESHLNDANKIACFIQLEASRISEINKSSTAAIKALANKLHAAANDASLTTLSITPLCQEGLQ